jgi:hypothetical protein
MDQRMMGGENKRDQKMMGGENGMEQRMRGGENGGTRRELIQRREWREGERERDIKQYEVLRLD